jgi:glycosyltransferase involved in cell wall biosynthesis
MGSEPKILRKVAFFYATFPRPTETFVRRELRALIDVGVTPTVFSIWRGNKKWEGQKIENFQLARLLTLIFWLPYWAFKRPKPFRNVLLALWNKPCPNLQNWNETFLGLGFALVEAHRIKSKNFQILHGVWATMPATAAYAISNLIDIPFSMGAHAYDLFRQGGDWLLREKFEHASFIRTSSKSSANRLYALGLERGKVRVIRRGLSRWPQRSSLQLIDSNKLSLLCVGRLVEKKGYFLLLQILEILHQRQKVDFRLKIVGGGPHRKSLQKEIDRMGLTEYIELAGSKSEQEVGELLLESDIMLFTGIIASNGDRDGIPNVVPEAMSAGCLVIASCFAGASEAFIDGVSGFSENPYQPDSWVELLEDFTSRPVQYEKIRRKAQSEVRERFDVKRTAQGLKKAFEQVIKANP